MARQQFNVPLSERHAVALRQLSLRDEVSVPALLRPQVEAYLDRELRGDADLATAVEAVLRARARRNKSTRVTPINKARAKPASRS